MKQPERQDSVWTAALAIALVMVLGAFLFQLREILSPFLIYLLILALSLPFRGRRGYALVLSISTVLLLLWVFQTTGFLLAPFVVALGLAYALDPLVDKLEGRKLSRSLAIALITVVTFGTIVGASFVILPALGAQVEGLIQRAPALLQNSGDWLASLEQRVLRVDIPVVDEEGLVASIRELDSESVIEFLEERRTVITENVLNGVFGLGRGLGSTLTIFGYLVLTPVLTFYLLRDYDHLTRRAEELLPRRSRESVVRFAKEYDRLLSKYLRGQVTVALLIGILTAVGLAIVQFPGALVVGALVAVLSVVPYLGLLLSLIPAVIIALTSGSIALSLLKVAGVFAAVQMLEGMVISPKIVGGSVGLHPVWIVLALSVGGFYFGFLGLLIAVPGAVGLKLLLGEGLTAYRRSSVYAGEAGSVASSDVPAGEVG